MKMKKRLCRLAMSIFATLMLTITVFAQQTISGALRSATGEPLAGATVTVKGTRTTVVTDANGHFAIYAPVGAVLQFSYVGYTTQEVTIKDENPISVQLQANNQEMNQVVVIGYQSVRKKDLTGSTGVVDMNEASKVTAASVGESIQGLVPGVTVRNGGSPGSNATVEIRGVGSFTSTQPLYVIDGMLADANTTINPDDIASIQILKDASAAAIYGSKAGNGVIIVTTKKGREGPARISISAKYGFEQLPKTWNVMNASQYLQTIKTEYQNSNATLPPGIAAQITNNTINTDWQNAVYRTGSAQDYNVSVSGGSATGNYLMSGSYYKNTGVLIGNDFERASLRVNSEAKKGRLTVGENMVLTSTDGNNPGGGVNAFYESASMLPIIGIQGTQYNTIPSNPAGWGMGTTDVPTYASNYVAVAALDRQTYSFGKVVGNAYVDLKLTNWLSYRLNAGAEISFDAFGEVRDTGIWRYTNQPPATSVSNSRDRFSNLLLENTLNFNKSFGLHNINGVVGISREEERQDFTSGSRTLLQNVGGQLFTTIGSATGSPSADGGTTTFWRSHGYLGRVNYTYNDRYLVTLTGRIDEDSRFGPQNRTGYFPSAAVAWRISRENFFHVDWISDLKLRASDGKLGISSSLDPYGSWPYLGVLNNSPRAVYGIGQTPLVGQYQSQIVNPDLHWETRIEKNIGLDAGLFRNRLTVTMDYYNALSQDVLVGLPTPLYLGSTGSTVGNFASIKNNGFEFSATYRSRTSGSSDFKWDITGNFTTIHNEVLSVGNQGTDASGNKVDYIEPTNFTRAEVGHSIGEWYVIKAIGIFQSQQEVNSYVNKNGQPIQPNAKPGDIKYLDANGDGVINDNDRVYAGSPWPKIQAGLQFNASYKQFSINIQFLGVFGNTIYDDIRRVLDSYQLSNFRSDINPWSPSNPKGTDPRLAVDQSSDPEIAINNMPQTSRWLESGSYVRLRNLEIGYTLNKSVLNHINFSNVRVYVSGQNLFTITKYKGLDPDVQGTGIITRGFDAGNWPSSRIMSIGLQCEF